MLITPELQQSYHLKLFIPWGEYTMNIRRIIMAIAVASIFTNTKTQATPTMSLPEGFMVSQIQPSYSFLITTKAGNCYEVSLQPGADLVLSLAHPTQLPTDTKIIKKNLLESGKQILASGQSISDFINAFGKYMIDCANNDQTLEQMQKMYAQFQNMLDSIANKDEVKNICCDMEFHGVLFRTCTDGTITMIDVLSGLEMATISITKLETSEQEDKEYQA